jgi:hypothetical protein
MPLLSPDDRARLITGTRGAALALVEDLDYFNKVLARPNPDRGELRRLSGALRRILIDKDILQIATPRIGRLYFQINDTDCLVPGFGQATDALYLNGAEISYFGMTMSKLVMVHVSMEDAVDKAGNKKIVDVDLDGFLGQKVIFFRGEWFSRRSLLRYVAYSAHGLHSGGPQTKKDKENAPKIERLRMAVSYNEKGVHVDDRHVIHGVPAADRPFPFSKDSVDVVLLELLATLRYLVNSPKVIELVSIITSESA